MRKTLDGGYRDFSRNYGDQIEGVFDPLLVLLVWLEQTLIHAPWLVVLGLAMGLSYVISRQVKLSIIVGLALAGIGVFGMWEDTMRTLAMIASATLICLVIGLPLGILMAQSNRTQSVLMPVLDAMQTIPPFVYLIPVVMLLGIGKIPGLLAVVIYAVPPVIRLTNLGIRLVDHHVLEAADAFGANRWQRLLRVQIPLALPNIFAGINQTIMMALAMVVIASMIGVKGLGQSVLQAITNQYLALGLFNGMAIVILAVIFDRTSQAYGRRIQKHRQDMPRGG